MDHFASLGGDDTLDIFEAWTLLAGMAARTTRTRIGCSVTGNTYRHPAVLAKAAVTVDHLSGGRLEFGIGAGWAENEHTMLGLPFGTARDRADWLEEALPIIRSLWTEPRTTFTGKHYQLTDAVAEPKPVQTPHPPIWIGGVGRRRTLRMAAEHAAVWNAPGGSPAEVAELSAVLDGHCADIGRDPAEIRRSVQIRVPADVGRARRRGRGLRRGRGHRDHPDRGGRAGRAGRAGGGSAARAARASVLSRKFGAGIGGSGRLPARRRSEPRTGRTRPDRQRGRRASGPPRPVASFRFRTPGQGA